MNDESSFPLISVVMATYNGERFIAEQLESILAQTYLNIEIIIVDDGSNDNTVSILKKYAALHTNILVVTNEKNIGYVKTFEKGMQLAKGKYVAPSDQDDIWLAEKLTTLFNEIADHDIVYSNSALIDDQGNDLNKKLSDIKRLLSFDDCLTFAIGNAAPGHAMLITKSLVEKCFPLPAMIPHDYWLGFIASFTKPLKFIDLPLIKYRQHSQNVFGAVKVAGEKRKKKKATKKEMLANIRERMQLQYIRCPDELIKQKRVYRDLHNSYADFSLKNNFKRMMIFFRNREKILAYKKKPQFRKWLFCFKMFYKIK